MNTRSILLFLFALMLSSYFCGQEEHKLLKIMIVYTTPHALVDT